MAVGEWFARFLVEHRARHPHSMLPELGTEEGRAMYEAWRQALVLKGIQDYDVATEASVRLVAEPPQYPRDHFPKLCAYAVDVYRQRNESGQGNPLSDRESAAAAAQGCERCRGNGLVAVFHPTSTPLVPRADGLGRPIPYSVAAYCVCAMGRWMEARHMASAKEVARRTPRLSDVLEGRGAWLAQPPETDDVEPYRPAARPALRHVRDELARPAGGRP